MAYKPLSSKVLNWYQILKIVLPILNGGVVTVTRMQRRRRSGEGEVRVATSPVLPGGYLPLPSSSPREFAEVLEKLNPSAAASGRLRLASLQPQPPPPPKIQAIALRGTTSRRRRTRTVSTPASSQTRASNLSRWKIKVSRINVCRPGNPTSLMVGGTPRDPLTLALISLENRPIYPREPPTAAFSAATLPPAASLPIRFTMCQRSESRSCCQASPAAPCLGHTCGWSGPGWWTTPRQPSPTTSPAPSGSSARSSSTRRGGLSAPYILTALEASSPSSRPMPTSEAST